MVLGGTWAIYHNEMKLSDDYVICWPVLQIPSTQQNDILLLAPSCMAVHHITITKAYQGKNVLQFAPKRVPFGLVLVSRGIPHR